MSDQQPAEELPPEAQAAIERMKHWFAEPGTKLLGGGAPPKFLGKTPFAPASSSGKAQTNPVTPQAPRSTPTILPPLTPVPPERQTRLREIALLLAERIGAEMPPRGTQPFAKPGPERRQLVRTRAQALLEELSDLPWHVRGPEEANVLFELVEHEVLEYGPLGPLLADQSVTEILVVGPSRVFVERAGKVSETPVRFQHEGHLLCIIRALLYAAGQAVTKLSPIEEVRLSDGTRVQVMLPPSAVNGPILRIRKPWRKRWQMEDLLGRGTLSPSIASLLYGGVLARLNIVIAGGANVGKTTLLNILSDFIPAHERIVTIEETTELHLNQRQVVALEARSAQARGTGSFAVRELFAQALHLRPQRVLVGECRGGETFELLQALTSGQAGLMTTICANSSHDCLLRLETQALLAGENVPTLALRRQIASAVHLIVQLARLRDGSCKVTHITEVQGIDDQTIRLQEVYRFKETGIDPATGQVQGVFESSGVKPQCYAELERVGVRLPEWFFATEERRQKEGWDALPWD